MTALCLEPRINVIKKGQWRRTKLFSFGLPLYETVPVLSLHLKDSGLSLPPEHLEQTCWFKKHVIIASYSWNAFCFQSPLVRRRRKVHRKQVFDGKLKGSNFGGTGQRKTVHEEYSRNSSTQDAFLRLMNLLYMPIIISIRMEQVQLLSASTNEKQKEAEEKTTIFCYVQQLKSLDSK